MAIYRVQGPDGNIYKIEGPDGAKPKDIEAFAAQQYASRSQANIPAPSNEPPPDTGFTGALKSSAEQIQADYERIKGKLGVKSIEEAEAEAKKHEEKAQKVFKPTEEGWLEAPWTKLKETAGGSLPYMVAPVAAGAVAGAAPVAGALGLGATAASMLGAGAVSAAQFTGSGLSSQVEAGKSLEDASLLKAAAAAIPQAALDVVGLKYVPGIQKIFRSVGQDITEEAAKKMLQQGTLKTAGQYIAGGAKIAGIEGATEAGQEFFNRLQAGLSIADEDARKAYLDNFIGGAALGAVASPFGVRGTRAEARGVVEKAQAGRDAQALQEEENRKAQEAETKKIESWNKKLEKAKEDLPDFDRIVQSSDVIVSDEIKKAILESDVGPQVLYALASDEDFAKKLTEMDSVKALKEIGKLEAKFEAKAEKPKAEKVKAIVSGSKAPEPIRPLSGGKVGADVMIDTNGEFHGTYAQWKAARQSGKVR